MNTASIEALQNIPGIGAALAARIIAARPFRNADDLRQVKGIGAKKYENLRPYFSVSLARNIPTTTSKLLAHGYSYR